MREAIKNEECNYAYLYGNDVSKYMNKQIEFFVFIKVNILA